MIFGLELVKFGSGQTRVKFSSHFSVNLEQCMQKSLAKWWSSACQITIGLDKIIPRVARVLKIIVRVGSVWPKRPWVGSNLGSGFDPTHL